MEIKEDEIIINAKDKYKSVNVKTQPYPGFPTDLQQPIIPFLTRCRDTSTVEETIYENRFQNIYDIESEWEQTFIVKNNKIAKVKRINTTTWQKCNSNRFKRWCLYANMWFNSGWNNSNR